MIWLALVKQKGMGEQEHAKSVAASQLLPQQQRSKINFGDVHLCIKKSKKSGHTKRAVKCASAASM
jgi:hypothetical protein